MNIYSLQQCLLELEKWTNAFSNQQPNDVKDHFQKLNSDLLKQIKVLEKRLKMKSIATSTEPEQSVAITSPTIGDVQQETPLEQGKDANDEVDGEQQNAHKLEEQWTQFFEKNQKHITADSQNQWKQFSLEDATKILSNGWYLFDTSGDSIYDHIISLEIENKIATYSNGEYDAGGVDLIKHSATDIQKVFDRINILSNTHHNYSRLIKEWDNDDLDKLYEKIVVPSSLSRELLTNHKEAELKKRFITEFQGKKPIELADEKILEWYTNKTGLWAAYTKGSRLSITSILSLGQRGAETIEVKSHTDPTKSRQAYDNGWKDPKQISDGQCEYKGVQANVVTTAKDIIDNEIETYDGIIVAINEITSCHDISGDYKEDEIKSLKEEYLPENKKQQDAKNARQTKIDSLFYYLTDTDERTGGISEDLLKIAEEEEKNRWTIAKYNPLTPEVLNEFLNSCEGVESVVRPEKEHDIREELKKLGGYDSEDEEPDITKKENILSREKKGTYALPSAYKIDGYDPDNPEFCQWENVHIIGKNKPDKMVIDPMLSTYLDDPKNPKKFTDATKNDLKKKYSKDGKFVSKGHLSLGAGMGKTTKTMACLVHKVWEKFKRQIILVCPTFVLANSAYKQHNKHWLKTWKCVVHAEKQLNSETGEVTYEYKHHGDYKIAINKLMLNEKKEPEKGISFMTPAYFCAYLACTLSNVDKLKIPTETELQESYKKRNKTQHEIDLALEYNRQFREALTKIKDPANNLLDDTTVVFDEADINIPKYLELIKDTIFLEKDGGGNKFNVMKMSATFKGKQFSIKTTYPIENYCMPSISSDSKLNLKERLAEGKTLVFLKSTKPRKNSKGKVVGGFGDKQLKILKEAGVFFVEYNELYEDHMEDISQGCPKGSIGIASTIFERGVTPHIDNVFSTGLIETQTLGKRCKYNEPETQSFPISSLVQQRTRVGRFQKGFAVTLSVNTQEIQIKSDLSSDFVKILLRGQVTNNIKDLGQGFASLDEEAINFARVGLATYFLRKNKTRAPEPEEMLISLQGLPTYPTFRQTPPNWDYDKELWARFESEQSSDKLVWDEESIQRSKELLKLSIQGYITDDPNFPKSLNIKVEHSLIGELKLTSNEAREVVKALVVDMIDELMKNDSTYDPDLKRSKKLDTIQQIASLHKLSLPENNGGVKSVIYTDPAKEKTELLLRYNIDYGK